jgi:hypothetical protein
MKNTSQPRKFKLLTSDRTELLKKFADLKFANGKLDESQRTLITRTISLRNEIIDLRTELAQALKRAAQFDARIDGISGLLDLLEEARHPCSSQAKL